MNTKNNLHNALKSAFENHQEPLYEAQWTRLQGVITPKKKRRFFPFFLLFLAVSITTGSTYFFTINNGSKTKAVNTISQPENGNFDKISGVTNNDVQLLSPESSHSYNNETHSFVKTSNLKNVIPHSSAYEDGKEITSTESPETQELNEEKIITTEPEIDNTLLTKNDDGYIPVKEDKFENPEQPEEILKTENLKNKDTLYINTGVKEEQAKLPPPRYAFSLSGGLSKMDVKVSGVENNSKMHKDTKKIFEQSNQNLKTTFINFGFDLLVFPRINIGLNTGIQYVKVESPVNINYQFTLIPFRDPEGNIIDYLEKKPPINLSSTSTNYTTYITMPLRINFSLPLNPTNEILLTAGANLSTLAAVKGESVVINTEKNEPEIRTLNRSMYRSMNLGYTGGIQYNIKLQNAWWIGLENLWQGTPLKYKEGLGSIKNKMEGYNVNLIIKYKI